MKELFPYYALTLMNWMNQKQKHRQFGSLKYANTIDNADELLGIFVDTFMEESYLVRVASFISL